ncbi:MAG: cytochrome c oxidase subunit 3 [Proteobacteria bacterium]|nr:cytochrome c oxidase subunit 3 [Pseudomonadota bacterium]
MSDFLEYSTTGKPHPFHIVRPSIWPLVGALAAGLLATGVLLYMHGIKLGSFDFGLKGVVVGLSAVAAVMFFWWKDVIFEAVQEKAHSSVAKVGLRYGMALFIASEVMFFVAFFWAFFNASLFPQEAIGFTWPPQGMQVVEPFDLPLLMTMILLLSGCTVTWAHHAILHNSQYEAVKALGLTVMLGMCFLALQIYEYAHAHFGFKDTVYASAFFMATGFHGFHVFVGTCFLVVCYFRAQKGHFTADSHFGFEAAAWYWHFVDVVWLFLFLCIYFWGNVIGVSHIPAAG